MDSSISGDETDCRGNLSDEYHEDSLPDLVLDANPDLGGRRERRLSLSTSASDLRKELEGKRQLDLGQTDGHDWEDEEEYVGNKSSQEVVTEVSASSHGVFKVSYVDHSKTYVPRVSHSDKYRSYLSLMPQEQDDQSQQVYQQQQQHILSDFRALSYEEQMLQRKRWAKELDRTEDEIAELKELLAFKTAWCGVLRRNLGASLGGWRRKVDEFNNSVHQAIEATENKLLTSQSLKKTKESFESLTSEIKARMKQSKDDLAKKVSTLTVTDAEVKDPLDANANEKT